MEIVNNNRVMKTSEWVVTLLVAAIPLVGFIMLFVWAFGGNSNENKANWAKATLIWFAVVAVLSIVVFAITGAFFLSMFA